MHLDTWMLIFSRRRLCQVDSLTKHVAVLNADILALRNIKASTDKECADLRQKNSLLSDEITSLQTHVRTLLSDVDASESQVLFVLAHLALLHLSECFFFQYQEMKRDLEDRLAAQSRALEEQDQCIRDRDNMVERRDAELDQLSEKLEHAQSEVAILQKRLAEVSLQLCSRFQCLQLFF